MSKTIVWLEDDVDIIAGVVRPLERAGYRFEQIRTVAEAREKFDLLRRADLILLDMILPPGQSGVTMLSSPYPGKELLREIRDAGIDTPVIVLSVVARDEVRRELERLGVADVIRKPVLPSELKRRVESVLETIEEKAPVPGR